MSLFKNKYRIETTRLPNYDYSQDGIYFITICTKDRSYLFGDIVSGELINNDEAEIVLDCWNDLPNHYSNIILDEFIVMPNHVHGIIGISNNETDGHNLSEFIRALKTFSSRRINNIRKTPGISVWQSRFYEHIIRNDRELDNTREYIRNNPINWIKDEYL